MRVGVLESGMFSSLEKKNVQKGKISMLFNNAERLKRYIYCLCIGLPIWFVVGVLVTQAPEIGQALNAQSALSAGKGVMFTYLGISLGDFLAGWLAQIFKSRRKVVLIYQIMILLFSCIYLTRQGITENEFLWLAFLMGLGVGYWATFITIAAEQFGTNIRSTVTTTAPNFVRGALIPSTLLYGVFVNWFDIIPAAMIMIVMLSLIAIFALSKLKESFDKDLDYVEE
jgi:hypothetical protein